MKVEHDALMAISEKRTHKPQSNLAKRKQKFLKFKLNIIYKWNNWYPYQSRPSVGIPVPIFGIPL